MHDPHTIHGPVVVGLLACLIASGCTTSPPQKLTIHDSQRGAVYLERIPDTSIQATHPITLNADTIARALRGIQVRDDRNTLQTLLVPKPSITQAFSDEDADFLAPFIVTALAKASPDQRIGFRINQTTVPADAKKEGATPVLSESPPTLAHRITTSGVLFAYGRSLQMQLTRFRSGSQTKYMVDGPNRHYADPTGVTGRTLAFFPKEAQRPDTFQVGESDTPTLIIDYELLARLPDQPVESPAQPVAASPPQPSAPPATAQEIEALKKELQEIKRQLTEQQSRKDSPKQKSKPAPAP